MQNISSVGSLITSEMFGGNFLANRNPIEGDGNYAEAIEDLGVEGLRYPGGSLTEYFFDINNPDSTTGIHSVTGEVKSMTPLTEFMEFASENGHAATIVIPTRHYKSDNVDENGDHYADIDEDSLRQFVRDVASGEYGSAEIHAFEIGNEYWHSADMTSVEYGRVAAEMVNIIDDELLQVAMTYPEAAHIDLIVQMGYNSGTADFNDSHDLMTAGDAIINLNALYELDLDDDAIYSSGNINYYNVANEIIISELYDAEAFHAVDGVVTHIYSWGSTNEGSRSYLLKQIESTWLEHDPDLDIHVTEWNIRGFSDNLDEEEDYGLFQASEMLNMVEVFVEAGVDTANVWPLIHRTDNALSTSNEYGETNAPGALFRMLAEELPGKQMLDFDPESNYQTEAKFSGFSVHGFADQKELLLYITTTHREGVIETNLDFGELALEFDDVELQVLGVEQNSLPGSNESTAEFELIDPSEALQTGFVDVPLDPGEILQIRITGYEPTDALSNALGFEVEVDEVGDEETEEDIFTDELELPYVFFDDETGTAPDDIDEVDDGGDDFGMAWLLAVLPLLAIFGMG